MLKIYQYLTNLLFYRILSKRVGLQKTEWTIDCQLAQVMSSNLLGDVISST